jgi:hypothetical protein
LMGGYAAWSVIGVNVVSTTPDHTARRAGAAVACRLVFLVCGKS